MKTKTKKQLKEENAELRALLSELVEEVTKKSRFMKGFQYIIKFYTGKADCLLIYKCKVALGIAHWQNK